MALCAGIPIQQINITSGTVFAGNTQAAVSIGVLSTLATLMPTYIQIVSTVPATLELHTGTPAATISTNRVCLIPGLGTINTVLLGMPIQFPGLGQAISIRSATPTPVTAGSVMINLWK